MKHPYLTGFCVLLMILGLFSFLFGSGYIGKAQQVYNPSDLAIVYVDMEPNPAVTGLTCGVNVQIDDANGRNLIGTISIQLDGAIYIATQISPDNWIISPHDTSDYTYTGGSVVIQLSTRVMFGISVTVNVAPSSGHMLAYGADAVSTSPVSGSSVFDVVANSGGGPPPSPPPSSPTQYTLTMSKIGNGTVTPTEGSHTYNDGTNVPLSASAATNYTFTYWQFDDGSKIYSSSTSVTMSANKAAQAVFNQNGETQNETSPPPKPPEQVNNNTQTNPTQGNQTTTTPTVNIPEAEKVSGLALMFSSALGIAVMQGIFDEKKKHH